MIRLILFVSFSLLIQMPEAFSQSMSENKLCSYFQVKLESIPHEKLTHQIGMIRSSNYEKEYPGCQLTFVSNDSLLSEYDLPHFITNFQETELYQQGWRRNDKYTADGPGTSAFLIELNNKHCLVSYSQSAWVDEVGEIKQSSVINITVECINNNEP